MAWFLGSSTKRRGWRCEGRARGEPSPRAARWAAAAALVLAAACDSGSEHRASDGGIGDGGLATGPTWTVIVYGHGDHNLSNSLLADMQEMAAAIPNSVLRVIPDAGHLMNIERPDLFTGHVRDFLTKLKRNSSS